MVRVDVSCAESSIFSCFQMAKKTNIVYLKNSYEEPEQVDLMYRRF